ncbi:MAG: hypothetical protein MUC66_06705 [Methanolinea sp.]|jgi:hypothetical protein|nr:hypothetical protein [Methanolinea sp.]
MTQNQKFLVSPVRRIGDRFLLAITRQSGMHWKGGCIGNCIPVALVIVEGEECMVWQLDAGLSWEDLRCALSGMSESFTGTARISGAAT